MILATGDDAGERQSAISGLPCSRPVLSTVTIGTPTGTTEIEHNFKTC